MSPHLTQILLWIDRHRPRSFLGYFLSVFFTLFLAFGIRAWDRWNAVGRVQEGILRNEEVEFLYAGQNLPVSERPYWQLEELIRLVGSKVAPKKYIDGAYYAQRCAATWSGWAVELKLYGIVGLKPGFGQALKAFPHLKILSIVDGEPYAEETGGLFDGIATLKHLKTLELCGAWTTDEEFAKLSPLKNIEILMLEDTNMTAKSFDTIRKFQKLKELHLRSLAEIPDSEFAKLKKDFPHLIVTYGDNYNPKSLY